MYFMTAEPARTTDVAALALDYSDRLIVGTTRDMHRAVSRRAFRATRFIGGRVPESLHDAVVTSVYGAISGVLRVSSGTVRALSAHGIGRPIESNRGGRQIIAAVNGLIGDELRMLDDPQAIKMAVRKDGEDIVATPFPIKQTYREGGSHLVIFLHGLCESDESWFQHEKVNGSTYVDRIAAETDGTPVLVRYNTGLRVSENGKHLNALIRQLIDAWPVSVTRVTLVGQSMGGLVVRAATNYATAASEVWPQLVKDIVCLGTPHTGANVEKVAHLGSRLLRFRPVATPLRTMGENRSPESVDLRHGHISKDEWEGQDLTSQWGLDRIAAAPLAHAEYHFVGSTLGATRNHSFSTVLGDLIVHFSSASGIGRTGPIVEGARFEYIASANHFALLNHPKVGDWLVEWLNARNHNLKALPAAKSSTSQGHP